jgi:hypothetical protein
LLCLLAIWNHFERDFLVGVLGIELAEMTSDLLSGLDYQPEPKSLSLKCAASTTFAGQRQLFLPAKG